MRNLTELNKLEKYCKDNGIPYKRIDKDSTIGIFDIGDRHQIIVYKSEEDKENNNRWFDAICQGGSYGVDEGLLEIYGDIVQNEYDNVEGWLTADEIISRM